MKRNILFFFALLIYTVSDAQSIDEAKKDIYYQRYQSAADVLNKLLTADANNLDARYWLGEVYFQQENNEAAKKVLSEGYEYATKNNVSKKDNPLIYIGWAHLLINEGKTDEAKALLEDVLSESKYKNAEALLRAARANIDSEKGDAAWALELLEKAKKRDKKNPEIYVAAGDAYRKKLDGGNAVLSYNEALKYDDSYAEALYKKGMIYKTQNNKEVYVDNFTKAVQMDSTYAPALYELYYHYFYIDLYPAEKYLNAYLAHSDPSIEQNYMTTDFYYVSRKYQQAVDGAKEIISKEGDKTRPRLYKLIAYSEASLGDSVNAEKEMEKYFEKQKPEEVVTKDYELMAKLNDISTGDKSRAIEWYKKALASETKEKEKLAYMGTLANLQKQLGHRNREAAWREKIYETKDQPNNLDLYNWGIALYMAENYIKADSVFAMYTVKYPDQIYGPLFQARCNALMDTTMEKGLAVPYYQKLIEVASEKPENNKTYLLSAYGYLGTYEANITKDYQASLDYFQKLLELDPNNNDAQRYVATLKSWIDKGTK